MLLRRSRPFNRAMFAGLFLLAFANVVRVLLERHGTMPEDPRDALVGLMYGLAIGCLLLGFWRAKRTGPPREGTGA